MIEKGRMKRKEISKEEILKYHKKKHEKNKRKIFSIEIFRFHVVKPEQCAFTLTKNHSAFDSSSSTTKLLKNTQLNVHN